nr:RNA-directed DNA polymerase, eukaryota [Tanacetum cinerariifolium]
DVNDDALSENGKEDSHNEADIIPETVFEECEVKSSDIKEKSNEDEPMYLSGFTHCDNSANIDSSFCGAKIHQKESSEKENGPSVGNSGEILCVWDTNMFQKENVTVLDYFISIMDKWLPSDRNLLIIFVYAPQELSEKRMLWQYLNHIINGWKGDAIVMGDFNEGFDSFVADTWRSNNILESNAMLKLIKELKLLKGCIRTLVHDKKERSQNLMKCLKNKLSDIDIFVDKGEAPSAMLDERLNIMNYLTSLENNVSLELAQKAKIKWAIVDQSHYLERPFSMEEVKGAVWGCGLNKSPSPDGFTFEFYHRYWSLIEDDVLEAVNYFFNTATAIKE